MYLMDLYDWLNNISRNYYDYSPRFYPYVIEQSQAVILIVDITVVNKLKLVLNKDYKCHIFYKESMNALKLIFQRIHWSL